MREPPDRRTPPILLMRPAYEWISRVNQKHRQLTELRLSVEQKERLARSNEIEFVYSTLKLEGEEVQRERVAQLVLSSPGPDAVDDSDRAAVALLESLRIVSDLARAKGRAAALTPDLLLKLHNVPNREPGFRGSAGDSARLKRVPAEHLAAVIERACAWYTAESFVELHPVEQASIVFLRLIEMQPFEQANERTGLVAASLFTLRSELPPIVIKREMQSAYHKALDEGIRMNTKPMVDLAAQAVERSVTDMIERIEELLEK